MDGYEIIWEIGQPWCDILKVAKDKECSTLTVVTEYGTIYLLDLKTEQFKRIPPPGGKRFTGDERWGYYHNLNISHCGCTFHEFGTGYRASTRVLAVAENLFQQIINDNQEWFGQLQVTQRDSTGHPEGECGAAYCTNREGYGDG